MKKKKIFIILLLFIAAAAAGILWGNKSIVTTEYTLSPENMPESLDGLRIVQVSDLHNTDFGGKLIDKIEARKPDMILLTGDLADYYSTDIPVSVEFARRVCKIAPVYFVTGNHESRIDGYTGMKAQLEDAGVIILEDETVQFSFNGETIDITGINDVSFFSGATPYEQNISFSQKLTELAGSSDAGVKILLSHRPEYVELYEACGFDVVFSGHAHGGQIRLPFIGGIFTPDQGFFPEYTEGVHGLGETSLVVSRGLGNSAFPLRIFNRPELVVCELSAE